MILQVCFPSSQQNSLFILPARLTYPASLPHITNTSLLSFLSNLTKQTQTLYCKTFGQPMDPFLPSSSKFWLNSFCPWNVNTRAICTTPAEVLLMKRTDHFLTPSRQILFTYWQALLTYLCRHFGACVDDTIPFHSHTTIFKILSLAF